MLKYVLEFEYFFWHQQYFGGFLLKYFLYVKIDRKLLILVQAIGQKSLQPMLPSRWAFNIFSAFLSILGNKTLIIRPLDLLVVENLTGGIK